MATFTGFAISPVMGVAPDVMVDLELSLVVDVSGSVSDSEYALQMNGYAGAFENSQLHSAISQGKYGQIAVNVIQFSSGAAESIAWTLVSDSVSADAFAADLRAADRLFSGGTNIDAGINASYPTFGTNGYTGSRQVIDVSGDGSGATGTARDNALAAGIDTINGIVIGDTDGSLADHYRQNVIGGTEPFVSDAATFEDFEPEVLRKLEREVTGGEPINVESGIAMLSTLRAGSIALVRTGTQDIGRRLARLRAGIPSATTTQAVAAPAPGPKSGMPKGGMLTTTVPKRWEVFGGLYFFTQSGDPVYGTVLAGPPTAAPIPVQVIISPDYQMDVFGGHAGAEYRINENWAVGAAVFASSADIDMTFVGTTDIDSVSLTPYVSYVRKQAVMGADFYADLMYSYSWLDYDTRRFVGATGSPEGNANAIEFNTGLNFHHVGLVHGPYGLLRWIDGDTDAYTEIGPGALTYPSVSYKSLATDLGYQVTYPINMTGGVLAPQFRAAWEHEFEDDPVLFPGFPTGQIDEDLAVVGAGIGWYAASGWNVGLDYEGRFGSNTESHYIGITGGYEF